MKKSIVILLHLSYWLMYLFIMFLFLGMLNMNKGAMTPSRLFYGLFFSPFGFGALLPGLIGFYSFYSFVFEKYLTQKKIVAFILSSIFISLTASVITQLVTYLVLKGSGVNWCLNTCIFMGLFLAFIALINGALGLVMKGFITWYGDIKLKEELNKKNYETELALIKSQINPHFLFNTINNIDVLIQKDAVKASDYLNKLSDIMRFMLYETKSEKILLSKELEYIEKYIELQKIRTTNLNYVNYNVVGSTETILIEPMLFIPFIENAFKHSESKKNKSTIFINIEIKGNEIIFECKNAYELKTQIPNEYSGLGNGIIKKRLELLYPNKHELKIINESGFYSVRLSVVKNGY